MATRKTATKIDPVSVIAIALKKALTKSDYSRILTANKPTDIEAAWASLSSEDQQRITKICNDSPPLDINAIADEITACGTYLELQAVKAQYGEGAVKQAWLTIPIPERQRLKALCDNGHTEQSQPMTEQPATYIVKAPQPKTRRSLFNISDDLEKLNELLDDCGDDAQQQELINNWLEQLGDERDRKLDNYSALIVEMTTRAAARKAEAQRLMELAASNENRAKLLRDRLKCFFETHNLKTVDTARYRLSLAKNGGKAPLILDASVPATKLPERFQRVSIDPDTTAIREALERGEHLNFAQLGERGTSMRIK